ncbi:hypothetical protein [Tahibacter harae]|uniref:Uncharacterized protein n=1 Tax=Tahibacter harae TaxID=2963937 RepID=A0ABT1QTT1_9GAMM|nr:hypothetical protein [Tahibacter harae]MCQ4165681.1 hypothetical protein [Tahibacter harae]
MNREQELELRLAESRHTETELRRVIELLLREGEAVFASRSWQLGRALLRPLEWLLRRAPGSAQDAAHWRRIAAAHDEDLARRRRLLEQLCADPAAEQELDAVLGRLWRERAGTDRGA